MFSLGRQTVGIHNHGPERGPAREGVETDLVPGPSVADDRALDSEPSGEADTIWDRDLRSMVGIGLHVCRRLGSDAIAEAQHVDHHDRTVCVGRRVGYVCPVHWIAVAKQWWCF